MKYNGRQVFNQYTPQQSRLRRKRTFKKPFPTEANGLLNYHGLPNYVEHRRRFPNACYSKSVTGHLDQWFSAYFSKDTVAAVAGLATTRTCTTNEYRRSRSPPIHSSNGARLSQRQRRLLLLSATLRIENARFQEL
jgi:hypothetical protein